VHAWGGKTAGWIWVQFRREHSFEVGTRYGTGQKPAPHKLTKLMQKLRFVSPEGS
jgi:hypothetical protein